MTQDGSVQKALLFLDVSTLVRWTGPPVGIVRVEAELARFAVEHRPDVDFVAYNSRDDTYQRVKRCVIPALIDGEIFVDAGGHPDPRAVRRSWLRRMLNRLDRPLLFVRRPRRTAIRQLERLRMKLAPRRRRPVEYVQSLLFSSRYQRLAFRSDGRRRSIIPLAELFDQKPPVLGGATVLAPGSEWNTKHPDRFRKLKNREQFRLVMVCHDLIPVLFPQFYGQRDGEVFYHYFSSAIRFVDRFICVSNCTARDLIKFATERGTHLRDVTVLQLGSNRRAGEADDASLPAYLKRGRYVLYVSTIEPRKNHALLYRIWLRLLDAGIPQTHGFQLIFVGRPGWQTDALASQLATDRRLGDTLRYIPDADDETLHGLYKNAAFCVYPSLYEGFGLPVIEAFAYGRAVIASNGGAIPELVQDMAPCLDPNDEELWYATLRKWIETPALVEAHEAKVAAGFRHKTWSETAQGYLAEAER